MSVCGHMCVFVDMCVGSKFIAEKQEFFNYMYMNLKSVTQQKVKLANQSKY